LPSVSRRPWGVAVVWSHKSFGGVGREDFQGFCDPWRAWACLSAQFFALLQQGVDGFVLVTGVGEGLVD